MSKVIKNVVLLAVFIICLALIIIGQKNISVTGLCMELIGLAGLLENREYLSVLFPLL